MLAGGGESCADIETLAAGGDRPLLVSVCSDTTLWRTLNQDLTPAVVDAVWAAVADVRAKVWARSSAATGNDPVVLDIDASLVEIHSENKQGEGAAAHSKRGFGLHPMFCFADATGEALAAVLRPGNAAANNIADHETVLDDAIAQFPAETAVGHRPGDDPTLVNRAIRVRTDSAGRTRFVWSCRARNIGFSVVARTTAAIHAALLKLHVDDDAWTPLIDQRTGEPRDDAYVADISHHRVKGRPSFSGRLLAISTTGWSSASDHVDLRHRIDRAKRGQQFTGQLLDLGGRRRDAQPGAGATSRDLHPSRPSRG